MRYPSKDKFVRRNWKIAPEAQTVVRLHITSLGPALVLKAVGPLQGPPLV